MTSGESQADELRMIRAKKWAIARGGSPPSIDPPAAVDPAVRDRVNACPDRGPVLPLSLQDDCGCRGQELSECRAGKGATPGRVTLRECLACQSA
jgi:hypothetical protein